MVHYQCPQCGHRWTGRGRKPGEQVSCPRCGKLAFTYVKALKPGEPDRGKLPVRLDELR